jgi:hypothetical protein
VREKHMKYRSRNGLFKRVGKLPWSTQALCLEAGATGAAEQRKCNMQHAIKLQLRNGFRFQVILHVHVRYWFCSCTCTTYMGYSFSILHLGPWSGVAYSIVVHIRS